MTRRTNKARISNVLDENIGNAYSNNISNHNFVNDNFRSFGDLFIPQENRLNFTNHRDTQYKIKQLPNRIGSFENNQYKNNYTSDIKQTDQQNNNLKTSDKKYGIKTLLSSKCKIIYPFDQMPANLNDSENKLIINEIKTDGDIKSTTNEIKVNETKTNYNTVNIVDESKTLASKNKLIINEIKTDGDIKSITKTNHDTVNIVDESKTLASENKLIVNEIKTDGDIKSTTNVIKSNYDTVNIVGEIKTNDSTVNIVNEIKPGRVDEKIINIIDDNKSIVNEISDNIINIIDEIDLIDCETKNCDDNTISISQIDNYLDFLEKKSDIEDRMTEKTNIKKIDIKNSSSDITNMSDKQEFIDSNKDENIKEITSVLTNNSSVKSIENETENNSSENKISDPKTQFDKEEWPELTVDMIGTSLKVVGDLQNGIKLKIVNNTHLAEDNSYLSSISRYSTGQGRDKVISFLDHLLNETERNIWEILENIRQNNNVDTNVSILQGIISKTYIFLHRFENIKNVYKSDSSAFARLGIIRDKYYTFLNTLFRDLTVPAY